MVDLIVCIATSRAALEAGNYKVAGLPQKANMIANEVVSGRIDVDTIKKKKKPAIKAAYCATHGAKAGLDTVGAMALSEWMVPALKRVFEVTNFPDSSVPNQTAVDAFADEVKQDFNLNPEPNRETLKRMILVALKNITSFSGYSNSVEELLQLTACGVVDGFCYHEERKKLLERCNNFEARLQISINSSGFDNAGLQKENEILEILVNMKRGYDLFEVPFNPNEKRLTSIDDLKREMKIFLRVSKLYCEDALADSLRPIAVYKHLLEHPEEIEPMPFTLGSPVPQEEQRGRGLAATLAQIKPPSIFKLMLRNHWKMALIIIASIIGSVLSVDCVGFLKMPRPLDFRQEQDFQYGGQEPPKSVEPGSDKTKEKEAVPATPTISDEERAKILKDYIQKRFEKIEKDAKE